MVYFIQEGDFWVLFGIMMVSLVGFGLSIVLSRKYFRSKLMKTLGKGEQVLKYCKDGKYRWDNQKVECGYLLDKDEHTQIAADRVVRTDEGDFFIKSEGFGLTYDVEVASATAFLKRMGFRSLKDALEYFDADYFNQEKNPENYELLQLAKEKDGVSNIPDSAALDSVRHLVPGEPIKNLCVKAVLLDARSKLVHLELEWLNDYTIPLAMTYRFGLQNNDAFNNKNIYDKGVLAAKKENASQGWTQEKTQAFIIMIISILIVGAIAFYIFTLAGASAPKQVIDTITLANMTK